MPDSRQIVQLVIQGAILLVLYLAHRFFIARPPMSMDEAISVLFPKDSTGRLAGSIMREQMRCLRAARIAGRLGTAAVLAYAALVPLRNLLAMPEAPPLTTVSTLAFFLIALYTAVREIILARWYLQPRLVLILRRFRKRERRYTVVANNVAIACRGLAVPVTIQDSSFRGALPVGLEFLRQFGYGILCLVLLVLMAVYQPRFLGFAGALGSWAVLCAAIGLVGNRLLVRLGVFETSASNYAQVLAKMFRNIRRRRWLFAGTRAMRFPDEVWRDGIEIALREADAVVIDVSEVSEAVAWEIQAVQRLVEPERVVLVWFDERTEEERLRAIQSEHSARVFGGHFESPIPEHVRTALLGVGTVEWFARCCFLPYERKRDKSAAVVFAAELTRALAMCFAHARQREVAA